MILAASSERWFTTPRLLTIDEGGNPTIDDPDHGVTAAIGAAEAWNATGLAVLDVRSGPPTFSMRDGLSYVYFSDPHNLCKGTCVATVITAFRGRKGTCDDLRVVDIREADVVLNAGPDFPWASLLEPDGCDNEFPLETVVTHEVGHLLGIGHSGVPSAVMYPSVNFCEYKALTEDDAEALDLLYDCDLVPDH